MRWMILALLVMACESSGSGSKRGDVAGADTTSGADTSASTGDLVCADGECTHPSTGYVWASPGTGPDPVAACDGLATANHSDYRLPTLEEAETFPLGPELLTAHPQFPDAIGVLFKDADGSIKLVTQDGVAGTGDSTSFTPICVSR